MRTITIGSFVLYGLANLVLFFDLWRLNRTAGHGPMSPSMVVIGLLLIGLALVRIEAIRLGNGSKHWDLTVDQVVVGMNVLSVLAVSGYQPVAMLRAEAVVSLLGGVVIAQLLRPDVRHPVQFNQ